MSFFGLLLLRHVLLGLFWLDLDIGHHLLLIAGHLLLLWLDVDRVVFLPVEAAASIQRLSRLQSLLLDEFLWKGIMRLEGETYWVEKDQALVHHLERASHFLIVFAELE